MVILQLNQQTPLPQGAEIKIPGVGITPIAVSTQLPAAVAQLSQQGMSQCSSKIQILFKIKIHSFKSLNQIRSFVYIPYITLK